MNGIGNHLQDAIQKGFDQLGGAKDFYVFHNPSSGILADTMESALGKLTNTSSISRQLAELLQQNAVSLQMISAHSQGTIIVSNAFRHLPKGTLSHAVTVNFNGAAVGPGVFARTTKWAGAFEGLYNANDFDLVPNVIGMATANPFKIIGSILFSPLLLTPFSQHTY